MKVPCENCLILPLCISTYLSLRNVAHEVWFIKTNAYDDKQVLVPDVIVSKCSKIYEYISHLTIDSKKTRFLLHDIVPLFKGNEFNKSSYVTSILGDKIVIYQVFYDVKESNENEKSM